MDRRQQDIYDATLGLLCPYCKALPGQLCYRVEGKPFHAPRMDKGLTKELKIRVQRIKELERLL